MIKKIPISNLDKGYLWKNRNNGAVRPDEKVDFTKLVVNKPWGCEYLVYSSPSIEIWHLFIKKLASTSIHCHPNKKTGLILLEGEAIFSTLNESMKLNPLDAIVMEPGVFHSTQAISEGGVHILETETPPDKYDLIRLQDKYGRVRCGYESSSAMSPDRENCLRFFNCSDSSIIEKDFYNKRLCIQNTNTLRNDTYQHLSSSDVIVILDSKSPENIEPFFSVGDIVRGNEFLNSLRLLGEKGGSGLGSIIITMRIKTVL